MSKKSKNMAFLSYTSELDKYPTSRSFIAAALEGISQAGFVARHIRHFTAEPRPAAEVCEEAVRQCGVYVGILGFRYGSPVRDRGDVSYTQLEYLTACTCKEKIPCLIFLMDPQAENIPPEAVLDTEYGSRQIAFRNRVLKENRHTCKFFKSADQLQRLVYQALIKMSPQRPQDRSNSLKYLRNLQQDTSYINIRGLSVGAGRAYRFPIEELYIPLTTTIVEEIGAQVFSEPSTPSLRGSQRIELGEVLKYPKVVIVGDPGAGKTTFLHRIANALCEAWLSTNPQTPRQRLELKDRPFPILVNLAQLAEHINQSRGREDAPTIPDVPDWLPHFLGAVSEWSAIRLPREFFRELFEQGKAILLLDGLDEAPSRLDRQCLAALIKKSARVYEQCRFVVTSRPAALTTEVILQDFKSFRIDPLETKTIQLFLHRWCEALFLDSADRALQLRDELLEALNRRVEIRRLARNPVMLTALAVVHWNERRLPEQRADLYESILTWLSRSHERRPGRQPAERCVRLLQRLALEMQNHPGGRQVRVSRACRRNR